MFVILFELFICLTFSWQGCVMLMKYVVLSRNSALVCGKCVNIGIAYPNLLHKPQTPIETPESRLKNKTRTKHPQIR